MNLNFTKLTNLKKNETYDLWNANTCDLESFITFHKNFYYNKNSETLDLGKYKIDTNFLIDFFEHPDSSRNENKLKGLFKKLERDQGNPNG